ncbi:hypothetical protein BS330_12825 [Amycolatopsis keratiniphila subsp. nogabecina]|uniref:Uncharacterized protein n=2 Tax=Amycolatopsis keratiniphila TaxID=129921 RepID=A0A1W2LY92_9PSEU|nr:hypothetical protein BS330_12825 [Amycolatopsis keratiniphila subsp. nogabecina]ONF72186.1 hypothetical protein AVR91_0211685 [Amycolatopsis keratiniphila subsp. keratiniphila]
MAMSVDQPGRGKDPQSRGDCLPAGSQPPVEIVERARGFDQDVQGVDHVGRLTSRASSAVV